MKAKGDAIPVDSELEFGRLLEDLSWQIVDAHDPWRLLKGIDSVTEEYILELNQTPAFWNVTVQALRGDLLARLGRIYDDRTGSNSLVNFLNTVKECSAYFCEDAFKERLKDTRYVDSLASYPRTLDLTDLAVDILKVSDKDSLVKRLHQIRNRRVAHRDGYLVKLDEMSSLVGLTPQQIDELLDRAHEIVSKYSNLFHASQNSTGLPGHDDYKHLLAHVRRSVAAHEAEIEEESRRAAAVAAAT